MHRASLSAVIVALVALAACKQTMPLRADDPAWFAEAHQGKDINAVRSTIDRLLEKDPHWSRGPHGLVAHDGRKEAVACKQIDGKSLRVQCGEEGKACELGFTLTDRDLGEDVAIGDLSEEDAQVLAAMLLRFCGWREPGEEP